MPDTPFRHFEEDMTRAWDLLTEARKLEDAGRKASLHRDMRMSALAMSVGAMDAYFCDAYVDCLSAVLHAYSDGKWKGELPAVFAKQMLPAGVVLDSSRATRPKWALRMAARAVMERDNMLSLSRIPKIFNAILPPSKKVWRSLVYDLSHWGSRRFTTYTYPEVRLASGKKLEKMTKAVVQTSTSRISETIQLRHDWAHNCGRPKAAIQKLSYNQALARQNEIGVFVQAFNDHLDQYRIA